MDTKNLNSRRVVITGGPCSGKTTIVSHLASQGYSTIEEMARAILQERGKPQTKQEWERFQIDIFRGQSALESIQLEKTHKEGVIFLDRGVIDSFAYSRHILGYNPFQLSEQDQIELHSRYSQVFVLDLLPFEDDGLRVEDGQEARRIHERLIQTYQEFGYNPVQVPVMSSPQERADFIIGQLSLPFKLPERGCI